MVSPDDGNDIRIQSTQVEASNAPADFDEELTLERIKKLSKPAGAALLVGGVAGLIIPGMLGWPLLMVGGLAVAPKAFDKLDRSVKERFPQLRRSGIQTIGRFLDDMEKRFPSQTTN